MVVKLAHAALYADVYPALPKCRGRQMDCAGEKRHKMNTLPALVEDDSESEIFEVEQERPYILHTQGLRRQKSISPQRRERMRRQLVLPSLSEDEEPWMLRKFILEWSLDAVEQPNCIRSLEVNLVTWNPRQMEIFQRRICTPPQVANKSERLPTLQMQCDCGYDRTMPKLLHVKWNQNVVIAKRIIAYT